MKINFKITREMVKRFLEITGDRNSLHVDEEFSRRFRYRKPVVHGMLPFSFILSLQQDFPHNIINFSEIVVKFKNPVFVGYEVLLIIEYNKNEQDYHFQASWYNNNTELIKSNGRFSLATPDEAPDSLEKLHNKCFVLDRLTENTLTREEVRGRAESFTFMVDRDLSDIYANMLQGALEEKSSARMSATPPNLTAALLISTFVGMKLPGRYSTLLGFEISYGKLLDYSKEYIMQGSVREAASSSGKVKLFTSITSANEEYAAGTVDVLVNSPPKKTISCKDISANYLSMGLEGRVVLVTGASRGIGAATAKLFAMNGAKVAVNYFKGKNDAAGVVEDILSSGGEAIALNCDISDDMQVGEMISEIVDRFSTLDILVNNAVKDFIPVDILKLCWDDYLGELEVSLKGMHNCCKEVIKIFKEKGGGKIIGLSSTIIDNPVTGQNKYITAKSAVCGYIKSLAKELHEYNIQVNLVEPNMTETDLLSAIPEDYIKRMGEERGRNLYPIDVAQSIVFLASKWADTMTGQKVVLNLGEVPFL